jgi:hypothetical protein
MILVFRRQKIFGLEISTGFLQRIFEVITELILSETEPHYSWGFSIRIGSGFGELLLFFAHFFIFLPLISLAVDLLIMAAVGESGRLCSRLRTENWPLNIAKKILRFYFVWSVAFT